MSEAQKKLNLTTGPDISQVLTNTAKWLEGPDGAPITSIYIKGAHATLQTVSLGASRRLYQWLEAYYDDHDYTLEGHKESAGTPFEEPYFQFKVRSGLGRVTRFTCTPDILQRDAPDQVQPEEVEDLNEIAKIFDQQDIKDINEAACAFRGERGIDASVELGYGRSSKGKTFQSLAPHSPEDPALEETLDGSMKRHNYRRALGHGALLVQAKFSQSAWLVREPLL